MARTPRYCHASLRIASSMLSNVRSFNAKAEEGHGGRAQSHAVIWSGVFSRHR